MLVNVEANATTVEAPVAHHPHRDGAEAIARHGFPVLGIVALALYVCWPLRRFQPWGGHDAGFYPPRYVEFFHVLQHGQFPPRWAPDFSFGYGGPFFSFNPPLVYAMDALFHAAGASFTAGETLTVVVLTLAAGLGMYAFASSYAGPLGGLAAASAYLTAPYLLVVLYVRHSMPDYAAFAFLPFSFWGLYRFAAGGQARLLLVGALGTALLVLSSNPIALIAVPALALGLLLLAWRHGRRGALLLRGGWCLALGLALSSFFWLPAYVERALVHTERLILPGYLSYQNHFVYFWQLVWSPWGYGASAPGPGDGMSFSIGVAHLAIATVAIAVGVVSLRRPRGDQRQPAPLVAVAVGAALLLGGAWLTTAASQPIWDRLPTLHYLQFPWRFLSLVVFGAAVLAGIPFAARASTEGWRRWLPGALLAGAMIALFADTWGHAQPNPNWQPNPALLWLTPAQIANSGKSVDLEGEFEPRWLTVEPYRAPTAPIDVMQGAAHVQIVSEAPTRLDFRVDSTSAARLRINIHYFAGWTVLNAGDVLPIKVSAPDDLMMLDVPPGAHEYHLEFRDTPVRRLANAITMAALLALIATVLWKHGATRRTIAIRQPAR